MSEHLVSRWLAGLVRGDGAGTPRNASASEGSDAGNLAHHKPATFDDYKLAQAQEDIRALEAKVHRLDVVKAGLWDQSRKDYVTMSELRAERDRLAGEVERLTNMLDADLSDYRRADAEVARLTAEVAALMKELRDLAAVTLPQKDERYMRIHELLAACERKA